MDKLGKGSSNNSNKPSASRDFLKIMYKGRRSESLPPDERGRQGNPNRERSRSLDPTREISDNEAKRASENYLQNKIPKLYASLKEELDKHVSASNQPDIFRRVYDLLDQGFQKQARNTAELNQLATNAQAANEMMKEIGIYRDWINKYQLGNSGGLQAEQKGLLKLADLAVSYVLPQVLTPFDPEYSQSDAHGSAASVSPTSFCKDNIDFCLGEYRRVRESTLAQMKEREMRKFGKQEESPIARRKFCHEWYRQQPPNDEQFNRILYNYELPLLFDYTHKKAFSERNKYYQQWLRTFGLTSFSGYDLTPFIKPLAKAIIMHELPRLVKETFNMLSLEGDSGLDRKGGVGQPSDQNKNPVEPDPSQETHYPSLEGFKFCLKWLNTFSQDVPSEFKAAQVERIINLLIEETSNQDRDSEGSIGTSDHSQERTHFLTRLESWQKCMDACPEYLSSESKAVLTKQIGDHEKNRLLYHTPHMPLLEKPALYLDCQDKFPAFFPKKTLFDALKEVPGYVHDDKELATFLKDEVRNPIERRREAIRECISERAHLRAKLGELEDKLKKGTEVGIEIEEIEEIEEIKGRIGKIEGKIEEIKRKIKLFEDNIIGLTEEKETLNKIAERQQDASMQKFQDILNAERRQILPIIPQLQAKVNVCKHLTLVNARNIQKYSDELKKAEGRQDASMLQAKVNECEREALDNVRNLQKHSDDLKRAESIISEIGEKINSTRAYKGWTFTAIKELGSLLQEVQGEIHQYIRRAITKMRDGNGQREADSKTWFAGDEQLSELVTRLRDQPFGGYYLRDIIDQDSSNSALQTIDILIYGIQQLGRTDPSHLFRGRINHLYGSWIDMQDPSLLQSRIDVGKTRYESLTAMERELDKSLEEKSQRYAAYLELKTGWKGLQKSSDNAQGALRNNLDECGKILEKEKNRLRKYYATIKKSEPAVGRYRILYELKRIHSRMLYTIVSDPVLGLFCKIHNTGSWERCKNYYDNNIQPWESHEAAVLSYLRNIMKELQQIYHSDLVRYKKEKLDLALYLWLSSYNRPGTSDGSGNASKE